MNVIRFITSPNFSNLEIPVRFVVLHFTAASFERTVEIFTDPKTEVSAHLLIDRDGAVYELVECLSGTAKRAWHAGKSRMEVSANQGPHLVEGFNDCSIGIELVNLNGNIFGYTEAQYASLFAVIESLKRSYPELCKPSAIVGHEQIAGFRGKSDPGRCFEWSRLFSVCYPGQGAPQRGNVCSELMANRLRELVYSLGVTHDATTGEPVVPEGLPAKFFGLVSALSEAALSQDTVPG
jgi:N-acetylmuramoyl-L-alanine amidase